MSGPIDFTKLARQATRRARRGCQHAWDKKRGGLEVCSKCGDHFPCRGDRCEHLDCIERGFEIGRRAGFPRDFSYDLTVLSDGHSVYDCAGCADAPDDHFEYLVDPFENPTKWITAIRLEALS